MFKIGDKVRRKPTKYDAWWMSTCSALWLCPDGIFHVREFTSHDTNCCYFEESWAKDRGYDFDLENFEHIPATSVTPKTSLTNLMATIDDIKRLDAMIEYYNEDKQWHTFLPQQVYLTVKNVGRDSDIKIDIPIMVDAMRQQRQLLVNYIATLGIDVNS